MRLTEQKVLPSGHYNCLLDVESATVFLVGWSLYEKLETMFVVQCRVHFDKVRI